MWFWCEEPGHLLWNCSGKCEFSTVHVQKRGVALVDSECSRTIVSRMMCRTWKKKYIEVMTLSRETCISDVRQIDLQGGLRNYRNRGFCSTRELFDSIIGVYTIKALHRISISKLCFGVTVHSFFLRIFHLWISHLA